MKLWADEPLNTAVIDFEYTAGRKGHRKVLQMAIANAHGEWIVPSTNINYGTSSEELESEIDHLATGSFQSAKAIRKIYDEHGPIKTVLFWSPSFVDFESLTEILQLAQRDDLIPPRPRMTAQPLTWWRFARKELGLEGNLMLQLGEVHKSLFPESKLNGHWHQAGADVRMTLDLINFYFQKIRGQPHRAKIENYLFPSCEDRQPADLAGEQQSAKNSQHNGAEYTWDSDVENDWDSNDDDEVEDSEQDDSDSESDDDDCDSESNDDGESVV
ncbi:hypothetical protein V8C37DRAFT_413544 [Trichoderma ceciliae]